MASIGLAATVGQARSEPARVAAVSWEPPPCPGGVRAVTDAIAATAGAGERAGGWFRLDQIIERDAVAGHVLIAAASSSDRSGRIRLGREAFAWGPRGGIVLAGSDDGELSRLLAFDPTADCIALLGRSSPVIRRAILEPDGGAVVEFRVDRTTRVDLGVWRRPLDGTEPTRLLPPIEPDAAFGITWSTELAWSAADDRLVVQSCGESACRTRVRDREGVVTAIAHLDQGMLIGLAADRLVTLAACPGLPCPLHSTDVTTGTTDVLHGSSGIARLAIDLRGRPRIVHEVIDDAPGLRSVMPDGEAPIALGPVPPLDGLVGPAWLSGSDAEVPPGVIPLGPGGRVSADGVRLLDEVLR